MKEIWKLIKLLNEYERNVVMKSYMHPVYYYDEDKNKILNLYIGFNTEDEVKSQWLLSYIVSKSYWFIKWLVDNDKIDIEKFPQIMEYSDYESLLMILSISDTPIEDLINYLK